MRFALFCCFAIEVKIATIGLCFGHFPLVAPPICTCSQRERERESVRACPCQCPTAPTLVAWWEPCAPLCNYWPKACNAQQQKQQRGGIMMRRWRITVFKSITMHLVTINNSLSSVRRRRRERRPSIRIILCHNTTPPLQFFQYFHLLCTSTTAAAVCHARQLEAIGRTAQDPQRCEVP